MKRRLSWPCVGFLLLLVPNLLAAAPAVPEALFPLTASTIDADNSVTFKWSPVEQANTYDFYVVDIDNNNLFYRNRSVEPTICDSTFCAFTVIDTAFSNPSRFVWRVAAKDSTGRSSFSHSRFSVQQSAPPDNPVPITPSAGSDLIEGQAVRFSWQASDAATAYDLYLYDRSTKSVTYRDRDIQSGSFCDLEECSYTINNTLLPVANKHVWRVSARNSQGRSGFSHTTFNVVANVPPTMPQPVSPWLNQELAVDDPATFSWREADNALNYDFYLINLNTRALTYRDRNFPASICTDGICTLSIDIGLLPDIDYVWRVAAKGSGGRSSFSHTRFSTAQETVDPPTEPFMHLNEYELVFNDEFNGSQLDPEKWHTALLWGPYQPINNEQQLYVDSSHMHSDFPWSPFEFTGDTLRITAEPVSASLTPPIRPDADSDLWERPFTEYRFNPEYNPEDVEYLSGIITSYESFKMTHGYVETRARLPAGKGLWPAFWMLPTHYVEDVPEIDVMEFLGDKVDRIYNTYHYFDIPDGWQLISTPSYPVVSSDWTQDFHTFGMEWSPRRIRWYVDGQLTHEITDANWNIAKQAMYLLANLAVGGNWPGNADASTPFPATYELDYIRAYKRKLPEMLDLSKYQIMFEDNFDGNTLDAEKWNTHFLWGPYLQINNEEQYYVDALGSDANLGYSPFTVGDGMLTITARASDDPNGISPPALPAADDAIWSDYPEFKRDISYSPGDYTSGILTSYDAFKFANGYAEVRAKIPKGAGMWPAFWLLNAYYVGPQPEIDIMEVRGELPNQIIHTFHRKNSEGVMLSTDYLTDNGEANEGYSAGFHDYGVRWDRNSITWYIDGTSVHSYSAEDVPYQLMYVLLNLAVGGDFQFSDTDTSAFPAEFVIDHVRVWQEKELP